MLARSVARTVRSRGTGTAPLATTTMPMRAAATPVAVHQRFYAAGAGAGAGGDAGSATASASDSEQKRKIATTQFEGAMKDGTRPNEPKSTDFARKATLWNTGSNPEFEAQRRAQEEKHGKDVRLDGEEFLSSRPSSTYVWLPLLVRTYSIKSNKHVWNSIVDFYLHLNGGHSLLTRLDLNDLVRDRPFSDQIQIICLIINIIYTGDHHVVSVYGSSC